MRFYSFLSRVILCLSGLFPVIQPGALAKDHVYNSLLWEITGNGLTSPSYLFGTMHISSKMVFHLSDSFYTAIRNADVVAIEINPEAWQTEIPRVNEQSEAYKYYNATYYTDYLKENTFTGTNFTELLQQSLRFEPVLNDQLLYRSERGMDNFQEDTYLDLYIYQTGKKLGKQAAGVETFVGSQRMMIEAYVDMAKDQEKNSNYNTDIPYGNILKDLQDAYRRGDLDMLDSLNKVTEQSPLFTEKFLYQRNEIQANAMDSIMRKKRLFVGVGAAHLPGERGVIELLRKKGYTLRPIYMQDRDAGQKAAIDSMSVPVTFVRQYAADRFYSVEVPGQLNEVAQPKVDLRHYADMANGSYYMITRINTDNIYNGYTEKQILKQIDSLLYENIPGQIISRKSLTKSGYQGLDIVNRTRKNDIQHYQVWVTPFEILIFKMGGQGNYVYGPEADRFFNSITFSERQSSVTWKDYTPPSGGFRVQMPAPVQATYTFAASDNLPEWRYEAVDSVSGDRYSIIRKSIYSFDFIEADTFDLNLILESLASNAGYERKSAIQFSEQGGRTVADMTLKSREGAYIHARAVLFGPQYYLLISRSRHKEKPVSFFQSFRYADYQYTAGSVYTDSFFNFSVRTPIRPALDKDVWDIMSYMKRNEREIRDNAGYNNYPVNNFANFVSETTGEVVVVNAYTYPEYFYIKDSTRFWSKECNLDSSLVLRRKVAVARDGGGRGWLLEFSDTASSRLIRKLVLLGGHTMLTAHTMIDSQQKESSFISEFYASLRLSNTEGGDIFQPKVEPFFAAYNSSDSLVRKRARSALSSVYFGAAGYPGLKKAIRALHSTDKDYVEQKTALIAELGYIDDTTVADEIAQQLKVLYQGSGDTVLFTNSILKSLSRIMGGEATIIFKNLILQDPPAFEERQEYFSLFSRYSDSLKHAAALYPELLNLATIQEFKEPVRALLQALIDSNLLQPGIYEDYVGNIFFDAKVSLKKIQRQVESSRAAEAATGNRGADPGLALRALNRTGAMNSPEDEGEKFLRYIRLLIPYYDKNPALPPFFNKALHLQQQDIALRTAFLLLKQGKPVDEKVWKSLAEKPASRSTLWAGLNDLKRADLFPKEYRTEKTIAMDALYNASTATPPDSISFLFKKDIALQYRKGTVYFFKYRWRAQEDWKLALSTITPSLKDGKVESYPPLTLFSSEKWQEEPNAAGLAEEQLRKAIILQSRSGQFFYPNMQYNNIAGNVL